METSKIAKLDQDLVRPSPGIQSLVKYETPVLVAIHDNLAQIAAAKKAAALSQGGFSGITRPGNLAHCFEAGGITKKETEEILNFILPPREWEDEGKSTWRQMVSSVPATRIDVINLEEQLNSKLKEMKARETGICMIRRELYAQCFDELIRQVTITCAERGLLLVRIRDEIYQSLAAYRALYESSTAYGMRKALIAQAHRHELEQKVLETERENEELDKTASELEAKMKEIHDRFLRKKEMEDNRMAQELEQLQKVNMQIKQQLETIIVPKKKHEERKAAETAAADAAASALATKKSKAMKLEMDGEDGEEMGEGQE